VSTLLMHAARSQKVRRALIGWTLRERMDRISF
jgi:hypothetical protein